MDIPANKTLSIIVAVAENGVIGKENRLLWHLSDDLKNFKRLTTGHAIIMGHNTYESIGHPLPNRLNIVLSYNESLEIPGCEVVDSVQAALHKAAISNPENEIFIVGGESIYRQTMPYVNTIYYTQVHASPDGDAFFPEITGGWMETERVDHPADDKNEYAFTIITMKRLSAE